MKTIIKQIYYDTANDWIRLYPFFDIHGGAEACDEKQLDADIRRCAEDPHGYAILGGDTIEGIGRKDPRANQNVLAKWCRDEEDVIGAQLLWSEKKFKPINHKILAIADGNHESANKHHISRDVYRDLVRAIMRDSGISPGEVALGYGGFLTLRFENGGHRTRINVFIRHGSGGGRKKGSKINRAADAAYNVEDADISISGHVHDEVGGPIHKWKPAKKNGAMAQVFTTWVIVTGSYLRPSIEPVTEIVTGDIWPADTYNLIKDYPPGRVGMPLISIKPRDKEIVISTGDTGALS